MATRCLFVLCVMSRKARVMAVGYDSAKAVAPWLMFLALVAFYMSVYAPDGLKNNDGGFMLGLAFQLFKGAHFYSEIH